MIDKPLETIEAADIESLVFRQVSESRTLEFKQKLPGNKESEVKEFLDDVTSLANAQGGDLLYGIKEVAGMAREATPIELADRDAEFLRLENILRDCVQPRLTVRLRWIPYGVDRGVLLIRVPSSLSFPHMRTYRGNIRFSGRNSAGKYDMDVHELREAFTGSEQLIGRFKALHEGAIRGARAEEDMPFALNRGDPTVVVTIAPLGLFRERRDLPVDFDTAILPPGPPGAQLRLRTIEGILIGRTVEQGQLSGYVLTHRDAHVDGAWAIGGHRTDHAGDVHKLVFPKSFEGGVEDLARTTGARLREFGIAAPWVVLVTVFGIHDFKLVKDNHFASAPAWRQGATFRPLIVDNLTPEALEPIFKSFWYLFGEERI